MKVVRKVHLTTRFLEEAIWTTEIQYVKSYRIDSRQFVSPIKKVGNRPTVKITGRPSIRR